MNALEERFHSGALPSKARVEEYEVRTGVTPPAEFTPMTSPQASSNGPPLLPGLMGAVCCRTSTEASPLESHEVRNGARLRIPSVRVLARAGEPETRSAEPGYPMAKTASPRLGSPVARTRASCGGIQAVSRIARSSFALAHSTAAGTRLTSPAAAMKVSARPAASSTTCAFVTT